MAAKTKTATAEKKPVVINWSDESVKKALARHVEMGLGTTSGTAITAGTLTMWKAWLDVCVNKKASPDCAREILEKVRDQILARRKRNLDKRPLGEIADSRVSEAKSILRLSEWQCYPKVFESLADSDGVGTAALLTVSKAIRLASKEGGLGWPKTNKAAPPREKLLGAIKKRYDASQSDKNGNGKKKALKLSDTANPKDHIAAMERVAKSLVRWFGGDKGHVLASSLLRNIASIKAASAALVRERKPA